MNTITNYQTNAIEFLSSHGIEFHSRFLRFGKHFEDDKQERNIFDLTLTRDGKTISFEFGSSLHDSLENCKDIIHESEIEFYCGFEFPGLKHEYLSYSEKYKIQAFKDAKQIGVRKLINKKKATEIYNEFKKKNTNKYQSCNIFPLSEWLDKLEGAIIRKYSEIAGKNFGEGIPKKEVIHPTAYDLLTSIQKYEVGTFENFCGDFGYDEDSRKAERVYNSVTAEWIKVSSFFTPDELDELKEIQ